MTVRVTKPAINLRSKLNEMEKVSLENFKAMDATFSGKIGIGTILPQRPLHIDGLEGAVRFTSTASGNDGFEVGIGANSQAFLWQTENSYMQFATNNIERMRIASDGSISTSTLGTNNLRLGASAGNSIASGGNYNTFVGDEAGALVTTGTLNTAAGYQAGYSNVSGTNNSYYGGYSGYYQLGGQNVAIGYGAMLGASGGSSTGTNNTALGRDALAASTTASNNTAVGYQAGYANTTGTGLTAVGSSALKDNTTGNYNTAIGINALENNTTASDNVSIGFASMTANTTGASNVAIGRQALAANTTASNNTAVGHEAGFSNTTGGVTALGYRAGRSQTSGLANIFVGPDAGYYVTTGSYNISIGSASGQGTSTQDRNIYIGQQAGEYSTAVLATAIGNQAAQGINGNTNAGSYGTFIGAYAGLEINTGQVNTFIGYGAGQEVTSGGKNTIIGSYSGNEGGLDIRTGSNYIVLSDGDGNPRQFYNNQYNVWNLSSGSSGVARLSGEESIVIADDGTLTLTDATAGAIMIYVYDTGLGDGGVFFATYKGGTVLVAESASNTHVFSTSDTDGAYCVYKSGNDHTVTFKNRTGAARTIAFMIVGAEVKST